MSEAVNISPVEVYEEKTYNTITAVCISGTVSSLFALATHAFYFSAFNWIFAVMAVAFIVISLVVSHVKSKRFGNKNMTVMERLVVLERKAMNIASKIKHGESHEQASQGYREV